MGEILGIHHLCVRTPDMDKSLDFYINVIGFSLQEREMCDFGEYAMLRLGASRIELIQPCESNETDFGSTGALGHFGFEVRNIDEVVQMLREKGIEFVNDKPCFNAQPLGGFRSISFHGPSGEAINLYEFK